MMNPAAITGDVTDDRGRLIAHATSTYAMPIGNQADGR
jgi:hypothetical protein